MNMPQSLADVVRRLNFEKGLVPWAADKSLPSNELVVLADGFNSTSQSHLSLYLSNAALGRPVRPFSYSATGYHYTWRDTWSSVRRQAKRLQREYLTPATVEQRIIPVGANLGGIVALLGTMFWIEVDKLLSWDTRPMAQRIPRLVLVSPALCPNMEQLVRYKMLYDIGLETKVIAEAEFDLTGQMPLLMELLDRTSQPGQQLYRDIIRAFRLLREQNISVDLVFWDHDTFSPHLCAGDLQQVVELAATQHSLLPTQLDQPRSELHSITQHLRFIRDTGTVSRIRDILQ